MVNIFKNSKKFSDILDQIRKYTEDAYKIIIFTEKNNYPEIILRTNKINCICIKDINLLKNNTLTNNTVYIVQVSSIEKYKYHFNDQKKIILLTDNDFTEKYLFELIKITENKVRKTCSDREDIDDLVQDSVIKLVEDWNKNKKVISLEGNAKSRGLWTAKDIFKKEAIKNKKEFHVEDYTEDENNSITLENRIATYIDNDSHLILDYFLKKIDTNDTILKAIVDLILADFKIPDIGELLYESKIKNNKYEYTFREDIVELINKKNYKEIENILEELKNSNGNSRVRDTKATKVSRELKKLENLAQESFNI